MDGNSTPVIKIQEIKHVNRRYNWHMILWSDGYLELPPLGRTFKGHCALSGP